MKNATHHFQSYLAARPSADAINATRQYFSYQLPVIATPEEILEGLK